MKVALIDQLNQIYIWFSIKKSSEIINVKAHHKTTMI